MFAIFFPPPRQNVRFINVSRRFRSPCRNTFNISVTTMSFTCTLRRRQTRDRRRVLLSRLSTDNDNRIDDIPSTSPLNRIPVYSIDERFPADTLFRPFVGLEKVSRLFRTFFCKRIRITQSREVRIIKYFRKHSIKYVEYGSTVLNT